MVDGDLSAKERAALEAHIKTCPDCAALYSAFSALSQQIGADLEDVPLDLRENVMAEIRRTEVWKKNRLPRIVRGVLATAAGVAVIVGVTLGVSPRLRSQIAASAIGSETKEAVIEEQYALPEEGAGAALAIAEEDAAEEPEWSMQRMDNSMDSYADTNADFSMAAPAATDVSETETETVEIEEAFSLPEVTELDLSGWMDLNLLRELLGGEADSAAEELLPAAPTYLLTVRHGSGSCQVPVYVADGVLYYREPVEELLYRAKLSPAEFEDFLS